MAVSSEAEWRRAKSCSAEYALRAMLVWAIDIKQYLMMNETLEIWVERREALSSCYVIDVSLDAMQNGRVWVW